MITVRSRWWGKVLLAVALVIGGLYTYMTLTTDVMYTPVAELPAYYWALMAGLLAYVIVPYFLKVEKPPANKPSPLTLVGLLIVVVIPLLMASGNLFLHTDMGGQSVLFVTVGLVGLLALGLVLRQQHRNRSGV